ncbi:hypothetical protein ACFYOI_14640 [Streptomyces microflavus]|uniref:hypothetical protein n=1 Tax=Streptomyces microflavus TaxID=1919 RepID=UPI0033B0A9FD
MTPPPAPRRRRPAPRSPKRPPPSTGRSYKESARAAYRQEYELGFDDAAQTCLRVLSEASDELLAKMKTGNLSKQEQALYARLEELREEMGDRLQSAWGTEPAGEALPQPSVSRRQQTRLP